MSHIDEQRRLLLQQKAIDELKERIGRESYLKLSEVCERLSFSRPKVEGIPYEVLPWSDYGFVGTRSTRRYHPVDVLAVDAVLRAYHRAEQEGRLEMWLAERRELLAARDAAALDLAGAA